MDAKRGKKRALEAEGSQGQGDGEVVGGVEAGQGKGRRGSQRGEEEMGEGLTRAVQPTPPAGKRTGKSRAASSALFNATRSYFNSVHDVY